MRRRRRVTVSCCCWASIHGRERGKTRAGLFKVCSPRLRRLQMRSPPGLICVCPRVCVVSATIAACTAHSVPGPHASASYRLVRLCHPSLAPLRNGCLSIQPCFLQTNARSASEGEYLLLLLLQEGPCPKALRLGTAYLLVLLLLLRSYSNRPTRPRRRWNTKRRPTMHASAMHSAITLSDGTGTVLC